MDKKDALNMFADFVRSFNEYTKNVAQEHDLDQDKKDELMTSIENIDHLLDKFIQDNDLGDNNG